MLQYWQAHSEQLPQEETQNIVPRGHTAVCICISAVPSFRTREYLQLSKGDVRAQG